MTTASIRSPTFSPSSSVRSMIASDLPPDRDEDDVRRDAGDDVPFTTWPSTSFLREEASAAARAASKVLRSAASALETAWSRRVWSRRLLTAWHRGSAATGPGMAGTRILPDAREADRDDVLFGGRCPRRGSRPRRQGGCSCPTRSALRSCDVFPGDGTGRRGARHNLAEPGGAPALVRVHAPGAHPGRQGAELPEAGARLVLSRSVRRARRHPGRARHHVPPGRDWLFPYYRDLTTCVAAGLSADEILLNGMSKAADVASGGRHMSNHFAKPEIHVQNVSSCVSNHALHARRPRARREDLRARRRRLLLRRRVVHLRGLLLRGGERRLAGEGRRRLRRPGQRLRDLGAEERPDREHHRVRQLHRLPQPEDRPLRRERPLRLAPRDARGRRVRQKRGGLRDRPRRVYPDPFAFQLRPARALSHARRVRRREGVGPAPPLQQAPRRGRRVHRGGNPGDRGPERPHLRRIG